MAYYPNMGRYYNETLSNRITESLALEYRYGLAETPTHRGIPPGQITHDVVTLDLLVRPRLPPTPIRIVEYNNQIVMIKRLEGGSQNA